MRYYRFSWDKIEHDLTFLWKKLSKLNIDIKKYKQIIPIGRGGLVPARLVSQITGIKNIPDFVPVRSGDVLFVPHVLRPTLFVDDIHDTGKTLRQVRKFGDENKLYVFLYSRNWTDDEKIIYGCELSESEKDAYIVFPWEKNADD